MPLKSCLAFAFACVIAWPADAAEPELRIAVEAGDVVLGDVFELFLATDDPEFDPEAILDVAFVEADGEAWHIAERWHRVENTFLPTGDDGEATPAYWMAKLQGFETGAVEMPEVTVAYRSAGGGDPVELRAAVGPIEILSARLEGEEADELLGPKPLHEFPIAWWPWALGGALAFALAAIAWWLLRRRRASGVAVGPELSPDPKLPPGVWALGEIKRRRRLEVCETGPSREVATLLSEVVRVYLGRRFGFAAMDMTSHECLRALGMSGLGGAELQDTSFLLAECDLAKFSKNGLEVDRFPFHWDGARELVLSTTPRGELNGGSERGRGPEPATAEAEANR